MTRKFLVELDAIRFAGRMRVFGASAKVEALGVIWVVVYEF